MDSDASGNQRLEISRYESTNKNRRVFKLHGSWDWERHNFNTSNEDNTLPWHGESIYRIRNRDIQDGDNGYRLASRPEGPWVIVGTWMKGLRYNHGPYPWLIQYFRNSLASTTALVVMGTSLNDQAINGIILDWLLASTKNRMLVVDPRHKDEFRDHARGEWSNKWDRLINGGFLRYLEKRIGKDRLTLEEIVEALG